MLSITRKYISTVSLYYFIIFIILFCLCVNPTVQTSHPHKAERLWDEELTNSFSTLPSLTVEMLCAHSSTQDVVLHYSTFKLTWSCQIFKHGLQLLRWFAWWYSPYPMSTSRKGSSEMACGIPMSVPLFSPTPHDRPLLTLTSTNQSEKKHIKHKINKLCCAQKKARHNYLHGLCHKAGESTWDVVHLSEVWKTGRLEHDAVTARFLNLQWRLPLPSIFTMGMESCRHHKASVGATGGVVHNKYLLVWLPV